MGSSYVIIGALGVTTLGGVTVDGALGGSTVTGTLVGAIVVTYLCNTLFWVLSVFMVLNCFQSINGV